MATKTPRPRPKEPKAIIKRPKKFSGTCALSGATAKMMIAIRTPRALPVNIQGSTLGALRISISSFSATLQLNQQSVPLNTASFQAPPERVLLLLPPERPKREPCPLRSQIAKLIALYRARERPRVPSQSHWAVFLAYGQDPAGTG